MYPDILFPFFNAQISHFQDLASFWYLSLLANIRKRIRRHSPLASFSKPSQAARAKGQHKSQATLGPRHVTCCVTHRRYFFSLIFHIWIEINSLFFRGLVGSCWEGHIILWPPRQYLKDFRQMSELTCSSLPFRKESLAPLSLARVTKESFSVALPESTLCLSFVSYLILLFSYLPKVPFHLALIH